MFDGHAVKVIIPALDEEAAIALVLHGVPPWVDEIIVVDNGSTDRTAATAEQAGARVVHEPRRGYGRACLTGLAEAGHCDIVVFLDGDFSDRPEEMHRLVAPIAAGRADMVIGSRVTGARQAGSLTLPQRLGNALACFLIRVLWRERFTDLGPFRAIRASRLRELQMRDETYGWTVEMQIKAVSNGLRVAERAVSYRKRIGRSKISGTLRGVYGAVTKILSTIARYAFRPPAAVASANRLIVFTRFPMPGRAKTRLIPALGPLGAALLQRRMTESVLAGPARPGEHDTEVRYAGGGWRKMRRWLGASLRYVDQGGGGLGRRMHRAMNDAFAAGCGRAVIIGSDCPAITRDHVRDAFEALASHDVVLGPSADGGYWLIGARGPVDIFDGVAWGTDQVLGQTRRRISDRGLSMRLLERLSDVDSPRDLPGVSAKLLPPAVWLSVIVPSLNNAAQIAAAVASARAERAETIVVDGGSRDGTPEIARRAGARVIRAQPGRARQMNRGAAVARGRVLLFLHADTVLPAGYVSCIFAALSDASVVGGAYGHRTDLPGRAMRLVEKLVLLRSKYLGLPYGDQAIFVRRAAFEAMGGFRDVGIAEDLALMRRLRRRGRIVIAPKAAVTSGRRWAELGILKTTAINQFVLLGLCLGIRADTLARLYNRPALTNVHEGIALGDGGGYNAACGGRSGAGIDERECGDEDSVYGLREEDIDR